MYQNTQQITQPQQMQPNPQPAPNTATFTADEEVLKIISLTYTEMASAMINLAIKKFSETDEFKNYFLKEEYRQTFAQEEQNGERLTSDNVNVVQNNQTTQPQQQSASLNFSAW